MTQIRTSTNRILDTRELPKQFLPIYDSLTGERVGWIDISYDSPPVGPLYTDNSMAKMQEDDEFPEQS